MRRISLLLLASLAVSGLAAQSTPPSPSSFSIKLTADGPSNSFPKSFTVTFSNATDHEIRLPKPTVVCQGGLDGTLTVTYKFIPKEPRMDGIVHGCVCDYFAPPSVVERAKAWTPIAPGDSINFQVRAEQINMEFPEPGKYIFIAEYDPPHFSKTEQEQLANAGINYPKEKLLSETLAASR